MMMLLRFRRILFRGHEATSTWDSTTFGSGLGWAGLGWAGPGCRGASAAQCLLSCVSSGGFQKRTEKFIT